MEGRGEAQRDNGAGTSSGRSGGDDYMLNFRRGSRNRESHDEVALLAAELKRAYAAKELRAQLQEKQLRQLTEETERRRDAEMIREEQRLAEEDRHRRRSRTLRTSDEYRRQLDEQSMRKRDERRARAEEDREYRRTLEEMDVAQEERERTRTTARRLELLQTSRRERSILEETRELRRREERLAEERKARQDLDYEREMEERSREVSRLRREQTERRERVLSEVTRTMKLDEVARKRERQDLLADLVAEEIRCELAIRQREEAARRQTMRQELAAGLRQQMVFTEYCKRRFAEQDRAWAEVAMRKMMEDERTARCTDEARRRMRARYRQDLDSLIAHRRAIRDREIARIEEAVREERRLERADAERSTEERRRLLTEHACNIAGFVNRAALTREERTILAGSTMPNRRIADESVDESARDN